MLGDIYPLVNVDIGKSRSIFFWGKSMRNGHGFKFANGCFTRPRCSMYGI